MDYFLSQLMISICPKEESSLIKDISSSWCSWWFGYYWNMILHIYYKVHSIKNIAYKIRQFWIPEFYFVYIQYNDFPQEHLLKGRFQKYIKISSRFINDLLINKFEKLNNIPKRQWSIYDVYGIWNANYSHKYEINDRTREFQRMIFKEWFIKV